MEVGDYVIISCTVEEAKGQCESTNGPGWTSSMQKSIGIPIKVIRMEWKPDIFFASGYWWPVSVLTHSEKPFRGMLPNETETNYRICRKINQMDKRKSCNP